MDKQPGMQIFDWEGEGYQPLLFSHDWQVALLNWEPIFDLNKIGKIERHYQTDEVFVLLKGKAVLFTIDQNGEMMVEDLRPNTIYNVTQGSWHNLISTRDATWLIVENRDTHLGDTELRPMTSEELGRLHAQLPAWSKG